MDFGLQAVTDAFRAGFSFGVISGVALCVFAYAALRIWQDRRP